MAIEGTVYIVDDDDAVRDSLQALMDAVTEETEAIDARSESQAETNASEGGNPA